MKKYVSIILAAAVSASAAFSVSSCGKGDKSVHTESITTTSVTSTVNTAPVITSTTTTAVTTTAPLMSPMTQPVEFMDSFENKGYIFNLCSGPGNTIFAAISENNEYSAVVFDPVHNKTLRNINLKGFEYEPLGMFSDGTIVTYSPVGGINFNLYPEGKTEPEELKIDGSTYSSMYIDSANDLIYWINDGGSSITRMDKNGRTSVLFAEKGLMNITNVNADDGYFHGQAASEETKSGVKEGLFSLKDGSLYSYVSDSTADRFVVSGGCVDTVTEPESVICNGIMEYYELPGGKYKKAYRITEQGSTVHHLFADIDSPYVFLARYADDKGYGAIRNLSFIDPAKGTLAVAYDCNADGKGDVVNVHAAYLPGVRRWFVGLDYMDANGIYGNFRIMMIDPNMLDHSRKLEETDVPHKEYTPVKVGEGFREVRRLADEIEEEFGIKLLVGNEVKNAEYSSGYTFDSVEDDEYSSPTDEIVNLNLLRATLRMYPKDFFGHFKSENGQCGLRIALVSSLKTDMYASFTAGGIAFDTGGWYNIVLGHYSFGGGSTSLHHELVHSVESLVSKKYPLDQSEWNSLNPSGFEYTQDFDAYLTDTDIRPEIFSYEENADKTLPYFLSSYSRVTAMEDRATLIEDLFKWENDDDDFTSYHQNDVELYKDYPHLKAKLDYFANWTKQEFGYVYWEETLKNYAANNIQPW